MKKIILKIFTILLIVSVFSLAMDDTLSFSTTEKPVPSNTFATSRWERLAINEVYYDVVGANGEKEGTNEWVELYNPTNFIVNLNGWTISDATSSTIIASTDTYLGPYKFAVLSKNSSTWPLWSIPMDTLLIELGSTIGSGLNNNGDAVTLRDSTGRMVDQMGYGNNTDIWNPACPDVLEGHSLARSPKGYDTDQPSDFVELTTPNPGTNPHSASLTPPAQEIDSNTEDTNTSGNSQNQDEEDTAKDDNIGKDPQDNQDNTSQNPDENPVDTNSPLPAPENVKVTLEEGTAVAEITWEDPIIDPNSKLEIEEYEIYRHYKIIKIDPDTQEEKEEKVSELRGKVAALDENIFKDELTEDWQIYNYTYTVTVKYQTEDKSSSEEVEITTVAALPKQGKDNSSIDSGNNNNDNNPPIDNQANSNGQNQNNSTQDTGNLNSSNTQTQEEGAKTPQTPVTKPSANQINPEIGNTTKQQDIENINTEEIQ